MAVLFDQRQRQGVARLVDMSAPVSILTPTIEPDPGSAERTKKYLAACYSKLKFALPGAVAHKQVEDREKGFADSLFKEIEDFPASIKRRRK